MDRLGVGYDALSQARVARALTRALALALTLALAPTLTLTLTPTLTLTLTLTLTQENPRLIYASVSGFGPEGAHAHS